MQIGSNVSGVDIKGNNIQNGVIENVLRTFGVAIVRTGEDRLKTTEAYINELSEVESNES